MERVQGGVHAEKNTARMDKAWKNRECRWKFVLICWINKHADFFRFYLWFMHHKIILNLFINKDYWAYLSWLRRDLAGKVESKVEYWGKGTNHGCEIYTKRQRKNHGTWYFWMNKLV
jgi:hypothetical protein